MNKKKRERESVIMKKSIARMVREQNKDCIGTIEK